MLSKDEFMAKFTSIGMSEDDAERRSLITELTDEVAAIYDSNDMLTKANNQYAEDVKTLQSYNMNLYRQVQDQKKSAPQPDQIVEEKPKKLKYEDLFKNN